ncbi:hypothetical protein BKA70DRAFT_313840 [Coprinopsis sp. MPI-PUGE-AT-0042]|nr:hypothetical protein BKA70DRAFT_313840 [Coprinopsis sp. MPI-PUGE-AT-0042]
MKFTQTTQQPTSSGFAGKARLVYERITTSRLTILYVVFSVLYFAVQLSLQINGFMITSKAANFLAHIVEEGNATSMSLPFQERSTISLCRWVDGNLNRDTESCNVVWSADKEGGVPVGLEEGDLPSSVVASASSTTAPASTTVSPTSSITSLSASRSTTRSISSTTVIFVSPTETLAIGIPVLNNEDDDEDEDEDDDDDNLSSLRGSRITISNLSKRDHSVSLNGEVVTVSDACLQSLNWPVSELRNTKREDITFIGFQFWVLGMSFVALMNESIPHILASLLTHVMVTAWAAFQITQTQQFKLTFARVITNGACKDQPALLTNFWTARSHFEIPALALHAAALLISCILTWHLVKLYGWQTFKRVGADLKINRLYKIVLVLSITIQLSLFFMIVTVGLWVDQLFNSVIGDLADFTKLYKASAFITLALLVPWLALGWFAVRQEHRVQMFFFLVLCILYLAGWGVMFFATTFRWTFVTWRFFAVMSSASVALTVLSMVLGVVCRFNFGKGLLRYLNAKDDVVVSDGDDYYGDEKKDIESVSYPGFESIMPVVPTLYSQDSYYSPASMPPAASSYPEAPAYTGPAPILASPPPAVTRNLTDVPQTRRGDGQIGRSDSNGSDRSNRSHASLVGHLQSKGRMNDHGRQNSQSSNSSASKRWVIE